MRRRLALIVSVSVVGSLAKEASATTCAVDRTVRKFVAEEYGKSVEHVSPQDKFAADGPHTIEDVEIKQMTEEKFQLKIPDEAWAKLVTVQDISNYVKARGRGCE